MQEVKLSNGNQVYLNNQVHRANVTKIQNNNVALLNFNTGAPEIDTFESLSTTDKYAADDGKISTGDKVKNFAKGLIAPVATMFSSPKNFLIGAGAIAAGGLLMVASGGALAPVMITAGVIGGGIQLGKSAYKAATATTDDEARAAWQGLGTGTTAVVSSVVGAKGALKSAGINTEGMNCIQATAKCITSAPSQVGKTVTTFTSGEAINNLKVLTSSKKKTETKSDSDEPVKQENKPKNKPENKKPEGEAKPEQKPKVETEGEVKSEQKVEQKSQQQAQPEEVKVKPKQETQVQQGETGKPQGQEPKPETKPTKEISSNDVQTIVQKDGSKITLKCDENGLIAESTIKKPDGTTIMKEYKDGKCIRSVKLKYEKGQLYMKNVEFKYSDNGKIYSATDGISNKIFKYDNCGKFLGYITEDYKNNVQLFFDNNGKLVNTISDFSDDIANATIKLEQRQPISEPMEINNKTVVRKTSVIDKHTGKTVNAYITQGQGGWGADGANFQIHVDTGSGYEQIGAVTTSLEDGYNIKNLYGSQSQSVDQYKGAGIELLKQCSIDSYNTGYNGCFKLQSGNFDSDSFYRHIGLFGTQGHFELPECRIASFLLQK